MSTLKKYVSVDLQIMMVGNGIESAMRFAAFVIYSKSLSAFGLGLVATMTAIAHLMIGLSGFGIDDSVISLGSKEFGSGERAGLGRICRAGLWLHLAVGVSLSAIACALAPTLARSYLADESLTLTLVVAFAGSVVLRLAGGVLAILRTYQRFKLYAASGVASALCLLSGAILLSATGRLTVLGTVTLVLVVTPLVKLVVGLLGTPLDVLKMRLPGKEEIRRVVGFGRWIWGTSLLETGVRRVNILLVQAFAGNVATGYFEMGARYAEFLGLIFEPLKKYLLPKFTALAKPAEMARALRRTYLPLSSTLLLLPIAWFLAEPVIRFVQGPEWLPAVILFQILVASRLLFLLSKPMVFVLFSLQRPRVQTQFHLLGAIVYFVAAISLIPSLGALGGALAMLVYSTTVLFLLALYIRRQRIGSDDSLLSRETS